MIPEPAAVISAALAIPGELAALASPGASRDMPIAGVAVTLRHMADTAQGLASCLRIESRIASQALTPVTARDVPLPEDAALVRVRLTRASQEVRWAGDYLHDAHQVARGIARDAGQGEEGAGKAPRLARACSRLVATLEDALADAEHRHVADSGTLPVIAGHQQVTEALAVCASGLYDACNQVRSPAAAACDALPAAGRRRDDLAASLFRAAVTIQHTRRRASAASSALADALTARRKLAERTAS